MSEARFHRFLRVSAGQPLFSNGVRFVDPVDRVLAGDDLADVAADFNLEPSEVRMAIHLAAASSGRVSAAKKFVNSEPPPDLQEREYMSGGGPGGTCPCGRTPDPGIKPEGGCWCTAETAGAE